MSTYEGPNASSVHWAREAYYDGKISVHEYLQVMLPAPAQRRGWWTRFFEWVTTFSFW